MPRRRRRLLGWGCLALALLWALPNWGPSWWASALLRHRAAVLSVRLEHRGDFRVVGYSILMFDHVSIEAPTAVPFLSGEVARIFSGSREDLHVDEIRLEERPGGIAVKVDSETPSEILLSDRDLGLLRWIGPRVYVRGEAQPLWNWLGLWDSVVALLTGLSFLSPARGHRGDAAPWRL